MTESMPPTLMQIQKMHRDLTERVLDKACSDPQWKQQFLDDPELAMRNANFPELQELQQASPQGGGEVQGQSFFGLSNVYYNPYSSLYPYGGGYITPPAPRGY
jgi:hypothetical protein